MFVLEWQPCRKQYEQCRWRLYVQSVYLHLECGDICSYLHEECGCHAQRDIEVETKDGGGGLDSVLAVSGSL